MGTSIDVRRAADRLHTKLDWLDSWHSFSFGHHYDPANVNHGLLIVHNDDTVEAGRGFGMHSHRDMEIVTWVLDGELEHQDSTGTNGVIYPGLAQRMSAGHGIRHSAMNHSKTEPVHFVQMWVVPDTNGIEPGYEQLDVSEQLAKGGLVPVASGKHHEGAIHLHQKDAVLHVGKLTDGETVTLPEAPHVHVFVARGAAELDGQSLAEGDAARLTDAGAVQLTSTGSSEVIVWETA